jgi:hypothetical protein
MGSHDDLLDGNEYLLSKEKSRARLLGDARREEEDLDRKKSRWQSR